MDYPNAFEPWPHRNHVGKKMHGPNRAKWDHFGPMKVPLPTRNYRPLDGSRLDFGYRRGSQTPRRWPPLSSITVSIGGIPSSPRRSRHELNGFEFSKMKTFPAARAARPNSVNPSSAAIC